MLSASARSIRERGVQTVDLAYGGDWPLDERIDYNVSAERFFYKGSLVQQALLTARLTSYSEVYFVGADVIDGAYNPRSVRGRLSLLAEAARLGRGATLLGASYNASPERTTRDALRALPAEVVICARDPVSRRRLEHALDRPIRQVADLAFLLEPRPSDPMVLDAHRWIAGRRRSGDRVIGLNANYLHAEKDARIPAALSALLQQLLKRSISIVLVPHDVRSRLPDKELLERASATLPTAMRERVYMLPPRSAGATRAVLSNLELMITGRMHAAILAMSGTTPAFCFAYQDKFEGLLSHFDLVNEAILSSPDELAQNPGAVAECALATLDRAQTLRHKIEAHLPRVVELARANFQ